MKLPAKLKMWALLNKDGEMLPKAETASLPMVTPDKPISYMREGLRYKPVRVVVTIEKAKGR